MAELTREEARERLRQADRRIIRLLAPVFLIYLTVYVATNLLFVRRWELADGALIVPLAALELGVVVADWRDWDRSPTFRRAALVAAAMLGMVGALLTGRI